MEQIKKKIMLATIFYSINIYSMSPELGRAIVKFKEIFAVKEYYESNVEDHSIKDSVSYHQKKINVKNINTLPKASWNQSNKSTKINYDKYEVHIRKYNIRKSKNSTLKALYKLWKYEVYENDKFICIIFWTENGQEYPLPPTKTITLHDLRFLIPFMQPEASQRIFGSSTSLNSFFQ